VRLTDKLLRRVLESGWILNPKKAGQALKIDTAVFHAPLEQKLF